MANLVINCVSASTGSRTAFMVNIQVGWSDDQDSNHEAGGNVVVSATASAAEINEAVRSAGIALAAQHGVTVGPGDVVRLFGGARPNVS